MEIFPEVEEIPCVVENLNRKSEAMLNTSTANEIRGKANPVKQAKLLDYIIKDGIPLEDVEDLLGYNESKVEMMREALEPSVIGDKNSTDDFTGSDTNKEESLGVISKEKEIISFAVYPEQKAIIEKAINEWLKKLPEETLDEDRRGDALEFICESSIGL
jgi:hypothetical protein